MKRLLMTLALIAALAPAHAAQAEIWAPLDDYVALCVTIVKAKVVSQVDGWNEFEITEVWTGSADVIPVNDRGRYRAPDGEHGAKVEPGQELVFFFTGERRQADGKVVAHSTAFPIKDGRLVYGATSEEYYREYSVDEFKRAVLDIVRRD